MLQMTMLKFSRRGSTRVLIITIVFLTILACVYYNNYTNNVVQPTPIATNAPLVRVDEELLDSAALVDTTASCPVLWPAKADVDTIEAYQTFDFQPNWMKSKEYWDAQFEQRFKKQQEENWQLPLKVIIIPHSHVDPGWLKTYENYFHAHTRFILRNMVEMLPKLPNMTFIWSEVSFLSSWWERAHPTKRRALLKLLEEKRLEITTGGWIMTDEANPHIYSMLDQLIEGHQWVKTKLNVTPTTGWSVDPFGHGSTVPYLLKASGISGTVIQRIHYAWKQWLAEKKSGDFVWRQSWDQDGHTDLLVHNQPFDIYNTKHSCGPHTEICLHFDFRKISGEYTEYRMKSVPIDNYNVKEKAELLLEQYRRTGSLYPHNVILVPLGDDFRFENTIEWTQQYSNYKQLLDYINSRSKKYNAEVVFGTVHDYFAEVEKRTKNRPTLKGDFFVYSDIFSEGRPAYWSGYYTTRPYWKILARELEANLRSAEILYSWVLNRARQNGRKSTVKLLERDYERLTHARRHLGLFQHHDAITGTSKAHVMNDYGLKLYEGLQDTGRIQAFAAQSLMEGRQEVLPRNASAAAATGLWMWLLVDSERESFDKLSKKVPITVAHDQPRKLILFNSLAQQRQEVVALHVKTPNVRVTDSDGHSIPHQINPIWNLTISKSSQRDYDLQMVDDLYELLFLADIPGLTLATYHLEYHKDRDSRSVVYCAKCTRSASRIFDLKKIQSGDVQLENEKMKLLIDGRSGFLKAITRKYTGTVTPCAIQFASYPSAQFHSGAYLFMPDPNAKEPQEVLDESSRQVVITSGPIMSQLEVVYGKFLRHFVRIYHVNGLLANAVYMENLVDFEAPPKNRETELFMRIISDVGNGEPTEFYTDANGFQMQRRVKVERIGVEGNYYPITTMAHIEDPKKRLTLIVSHAQGATSWQQGWLEVMLDRRTLYDDARGMGEGVVDNKQTLMRYYLLLEEISSAAVQNPPSSVSRPSLLAQHLSNSLNYPTNIFVVDESVSANHLKPYEQLFNAALPCDIHLMNLRTLSDESSFPSRNALLIAQRQGYACDIDGEKPGKCQFVSGDFKKGLNGALVHRGTAFHHLKVEGCVRTSLTGLYPIENCDSLEDVAIAPIDLVTVNITFAT